MHCFHQNPAFHRRSCCTSGCSQSCQHHLWYVQLVYCIFNIPSVPIPLSCLIFCDHIDDWNLHILNNCRSFFLKKLYNYISKIYIVCFGFSEIIDHKKSNKIKEVGQMEYIWYVWIQSNSDKVWSLYIWMGNQFWQYV